MAASIPARAGLALAAVLAATGGIYLAGGGRLPWRVVGAGGEPRAAAPAPGPALADGSQAPAWKPAPLAFRAVSLAGRLGAPAAGGLPSFADVDGDGAADLFVAGGELGAAELFLARPGGPGVDGALLLGLPAEARYGSGAFADFDDDGDRDLYLTGLGDTPDELLRQLPDGRFEPATEEYELASDLPGRTRSARWADLDGDGRLDLLLARVGAPDGFARRRPGATFVEQALDAGLGGALGALSLFVGDLDGDLDPDVLASRGDSSLGDRVLAGRGDGVFVELGALPGLERALASTCAAQGDVDGDGLLDLFLAHPAGGGALLFARRDASGRVEYEPRDDLPPLPLDGRRVESARFADLDLDGALELVAIGPRGLALLRGLGDGRFVDVTASAGFAGLGAGGGRAFALADRDLDGDLDLALAGGGDGVLLLENQQRGGHWLRVRAPGRAGNAEGVGALVRVALADGRRLVRPILAGPDEPALTIGLGAASSALEVRVEWSDGGRARVQGVPAGEELVLLRSSGAALVASHPAALLGEAPSFELEPALERASKALGAKLPPVAADEVEARLRALEVWIASRPAPDPGEERRAAARARVEAESRLELAARVLAQRLHVDPERVERHAAARRHEWDRPARVAGSAWRFEDAATADRARAELCGELPGPGASVLGEAHAYALDAPTWARLQGAEPAPFGGLALPEPGSVSRVFRRGGGFGLLRVEQVLPPAPLPPREARARAEADLLRALVGRELDALLGIAAPERAPVRQL